MILGMDDTGGRMRAERGDDDSCMYMLAGRLKVYRKGIEER